MTISLNAIVAPFITFDLIIGNTSIHEWNLYHVIRSANAKKKRTTLSRLLAHPPQYESAKPTRNSLDDRSDAESIDSTTSQHCLDLARADGIVDSTKDYDTDVDDDPPDSFPDTDTILSYASALSKANLQDSNSLSGDSVESQYTSDDEKILHPRSNSQRQQRLTAHNLAILQQQYRTRDTETESRSTDGLSELDAMSLFADDVQYNKTRDELNQQDTSDSDDDSSTSRSTHNEKMDKSDEDARSFTSEDFDKEPSVNDEEFTKAFSPMLYPHLSDDAYNRMMKVLYRHKSRFSEYVHPRGADVPPMEINFKPNKDIPRQLFARPRRMATIIDDEIHETVRKLILLDMVEEIKTAQFYSQVLVVKKKQMDGSTKSRFCIDYRHINLIIDTYRWPLPLIDDLIRRLGGNAVFSTLDLTQGFHQCKLSKKARKFTAFITSRGLYQYKRVPFGLSGGPSYFQHIIQNVVLRGLVPSACLVYIDDVIVFGKDEKEHAENLGKVLARFEKHRVTCKPSKCKFHFPEVGYLGHVISSEGVTLSDERRKHIANIREPTIVSELHSFLGLVNFFRDHIKNFSKLSGPLYKYLKRSKRSKIPWREDDRTSFRLLKQAVVDAPILRYMREEGDIVLFTDASDMALGGHLVQYINDVPNTICFVSKKFNDTQTRWSTTEKELYAIVYSVLKLRAMLGGRQFTVRTDHKTLTHWYSENDTPKVYRWKQRLLEFTFDIVHVVGEVNCVADALSRLCIGNARPAKKSSIANLPKAPSVDIYTESRPVSQTIRSRTSGNALKAKQPRRVSKITTVCTPLRVREVLPERGTIPQDREDTIRQFHNDFAGHSNTLKRLQHAGHKWKYMREHVDSFIRLCPACQLINSNTRPAAGQHFTVLKSRPFQTVYIDSIVNLTGDPNYSHIVVFICGMSRFVRLFHVKDLTSENFKNALITYLNQYHPEKLFWDNHGQFNNSLIDDVLQDFGISKESSAPYSHQENSLVERSIQSIRAHFSKWQIGHPTEHWSTFTSYCESIMNSQLIPDMQYTPFEVVYGTSFKNRHQTPTTIEQHVNELDIFSETVVTKAHDIIRKKNDKNTQHNDSVKPHRYAAGARVLVKNFKHKKQFNSPLWKGPFTVVRVDGDHLILADLLRTGIARPVHVKHVKPLSDECNLDEMNANTGTEEFFEVEAITSHHISTRGAVTVTVKWAGYPDTTDELLSKNPSIKRTEAFVRYAKSVPELRYLTDNIEVFEPTGKT
jgi:hypothetical protein